MTPPAGSVVMITHDRAARAVEAVARLLALPEAWPVIVVDDAGADGTAGVLRERYGSRIRVIRLEENLGGAARTVGVRAASTDVVAFADDDSGWAPGSLARAAEVLDAAPDVAVVVASVVVGADEHPDPIVAQLASSPLRATPHGPTVLGFLACGAVVRRRAYLDAGGFHPVLHVGGEEELLAVDLRARGWSLVHVPDVVAHHAPDTADAGRGARAARQVRNRLLVAWMRRPVRTAARMTARAALDGVRRRPGGRGVWEAVRLLPRVLPERRALPPDVEAEVRLVESAPVAVSGGTTRCAA